MLDFIHHLGGKITVTSIALLICSFYIFCSLLKNNKLRLSIAVFSSLFISLQIISLFFTQTFISYKFFIHMNLRGLTGLSGLFIPQIIGIIFFFILYIYLNYQSYFFIKRQTELKRKVNLLANKAFITFFILMSISFVVIKSSFLNDSSSVFSVLYLKKLKFNEALEKYNFKGYVTPDQIKCKSGKNMIIISLESIERAYLSEKHSSLTPNLNKLKNKWSYYDIEPNNGSDWTSGSLYTYLTGFPAFFGIHGNQIFQKAYHSEISSISHVLEKANYSTTYLNGNTEHSGVINMLNVFEFNKIIDVKNTKKTHYESEYGIRDKDLFELSKIEVNNLQKSGKPFALFISTTDTHFPNGIYDSRMESVISKKNSDLEFMVASLDYLIGNFVSYLEQNGILENTVVYIFPDHLKMGDPSLFKNTGDRGLYLITNSNKTDLINDTLNLTYQIDLPKILLKGAEIDHNLKFFTDYIHGNKDKFIMDNVRLITELNTNGLLRMRSKPDSVLQVSKNYSEYKKDTFRYIAHAGGEIDGNNYTNSKEALDLSYKKGFRLIELDILQTKDNKFVAAHNWEDWSEMTNYKGNLPVTHSEFINYKIYKKYTPLDMGAINKWFSDHKDAILVTDKVNEPINFSNEFIDSNRLIMELFDMDAVKEGIDANILSAMPSQSVIDNISKEEVKYLADLGVKNIAISRNFIESNKELLAEFKKHSIKPYAYLINYDPDIDEEYVTKYEMDYIYGIFADDWSFK